MTKFHVLSAGGRSFQITRNKSDKGTCMANTNNMAESIVPSSYQEEPLWKRATNHVNHEKGSVGSNYSAYTIDSRWFPMNSIQIQSRLLWN